MASMAPIWPTVISQRLTPYVSVFAPKGITPPFGIQPSDLTKVLANCREPALLQARAGSHELPKAPELSGPFPPPPQLPERPQAPAEPHWRDYAPSHPDGGFWARLGDSLSGARAAREKAARTRFETDKATWKRTRQYQERIFRAWEHSHQLWEQNTRKHDSQKAQLEQALATATSAYAAYSEQIAAERTADLAKFDALLESASNGEVSSIEELAVHACLAIPMPLTLPSSPIAHFDETTGILLLTVQAPNLSESRVYVPLKTKQREATEKEIRAAQEYLIHALALRVLHEIYGMAEFSRVEMVGVNLALAYTDRRNGKRMDEVVASVAATRGEFAGIDIANVDAKLCFRSLKGIATPSFQEPAPVRPLLSFGNTDGRIIASRDVVDNLEQETNLATLDWEDFEHIVRELFAKLFSARAEAEVHVTRASRDYGVDALIFDPDPIHGGKFVIQAKRYVNTVDVAAVRDLYGTVQNEGANRGYLVTTSSFGPEAYAFAKGKPLTLIDGGHLLQLLKEHGYGFRIDLIEARQLLHGRA